MHTHAVVANSTCAEGRDTALDGRALYAHHRTAGFLYQAALRKNLSDALGVEGEPVRNGMAEIRGTLSDDGEAYVGLAGSEPPEVRESVALDALEEAEGLPALDSLVLDFDFYGRLVGIRVTSGASSALPPALLDAADRR